MVSFYFIFSRLLQQLTENAWSLKNGKDLNHLIQELKNNNILQSEIVSKSMLAVDRGNYTTTKTGAYDDKPQYIGYDATISAPHMHVWALQLFEDVLKPNMKVLDVGSGSGYLTACMANMLMDSYPNEKGKVIGIDIVPELVAYAQEKIRLSNPELLEPEGNLSIMSADGWEGVEKEAPFDFIHVGAAASEIPNSLINQLSLGGRMVIPVGPKNQTQKFWLIDKPINPNESIIKKSLLNVIYVPLVKKPL